MSTLAERVAARRQQEQPAAPRAPELRKLVDWRKTVAPAESEWDDVLWVSQPPPVLGVPWRR